MWGKLFFNTLIFIGTVISALLSGADWWRGRPADWYVWVMAAFMTAIVLGAAISEGAKAVLCIVRRRRRRDLLSQTFDDYGQR